MVVTDAGMVSAVSAVQPVNTLLSKVVSVLGRVMDVSAVQPLNMAGLRVVMPEARVTLLSLEHWWKVFPQYSLPLV